MATQLKKVVAPSGGDYTALETCMNANEQNLVTADQYFDVEISGTWSSADTTAVTIHNYTTDATRYINIYTTGSARHSGKWSDTAHRIVGTAGGQFGWSVPYTRISGIQVTSTGTSYGNHLVNIQTGDGFTNYYGGIVDSCIFFANWSETDWSGAVFRTYASANILIKNTIMYGTSKGTAVALIPHAHVYNCTIYSTSGEADYCVTGFDGSEVKNTIAGGSDVADFSTSTNVTYSISEDSSLSSGTGNLSGKTMSNQFVSLTGGSEDFHLKAGADAIDAGTDLSGTFTTDIDGVTRSGTWDIGADEYVATASAATGYMTTNTGYWSVAWLVMVLRFLA